MRKYIDRYIGRTTSKGSKWIFNEAYKFEFANYIHSNVDFDTQTDEEVLEILIKSQKTKYDGMIGAQFIQKSGRERLSFFVDLDDVRRFRSFKYLEFNEIDWANRTMSFPGISAWLSSLFPHKIYPVPKTEMEIVINYLFDIDLSKCSKKGMGYILNCQEYMRKTELELRKYLPEENYLKIWNTFFAKNPDLKIHQKTHLEKIDWVWLVQDFYLFVLWEIIGYNNPKDKKKVSKEDTKHVSTEGKRKLASHMIYERNHPFIKKIKENAFKNNLMLNCEVCKFSFYKEYGDIGKGFIEAHHITPLSKSRETKVTKNDIALLCSNCHKMIHKTISDNKENSIMSLEEFKKAYNNRQ